MAVHFHILPTGRHVSVIKGSRWVRAGGFACNGALRNVILLLAFDGWEVCQRACVCVYSVKCVPHVDSGLVLHHLSLSGERASWWQTAVISLSHCSSAVQCTCVVVLKYFTRSFPTGLQSLVQCGCIWRLNRQRCAIEIIQRSKPESDLYRQVHASSVWWRSITRNRIFLDLFT